MMTADAARDGSPAFAVTGWLLVLTWLFVAVFALGVIASAALFALGPEWIERVLHLQVNEPPAVTVWWIGQQLLYVLFGILCIGVLLRDRGSASTAVWVAWAVAGVQCLVAAAQLVHLRLSVPIGAVFYAAFAIGLSSRLRKGRPEPGGARGTI